MIRTGVAIAGTRNCNGETKLHYKLLDFSVPLLYTPACRRVHSFLTCGGLVQTFQRRIKSMKGYILCRSQARIHVCPSDRAFVTLRRLRRAHKPTPAHALISNPLLNDAVTTGGILLTATSMVYVLHFLTLKSFIDRKDTRKMVHILCGPLLLLFWPLYSATSLATAFATVIPCAAALALFLTGTGALDFKAMTAVSRGGDRQELLRGPFIYCLVLAVVMGMQWQVTLPGICAIAIMCAGDGFADIFGRRFGKNRLPWNKGKSAEGSAAMFTFGAALAMGLVAYFHDQGLMALTASNAFPVIVWTSFICTGVESIPATYIDDNVSVPFVAAVFAYMLGRIPAGL